jgi:hypothetical protein
MKPFYGKRSDFSETVSWRVKALRVFGSLILLKLGYEFGMWDGEYFNKKLKESVVVDFESEEQIYDYLFNKDMTAVFLMLYHPGHFLCENFNKHMEMISPRYM